MTNSSPEVLRLAVDFSIQRWFPLHDKPTEENWEVFINFPSHLLLSTAKAVSLHFCIKKRNNRSDIWQPNNIYSFYTSWQVGRMIPYALSHWRSTHILKKSRNDYIQLRINNAYQSIPKSKVFIFKINYYAVNLSVHKERPPKTFLPSFLQPSLTSSKMHL